MFGRFAKIMMICAFAMLLAGAGPVKVEPSEQTRMLKIGTVAPDATPWSRYIKDFATNLKKKSKGRLGFDMGFGAVYGGETELVRLCRTGRIAIVGVSSTIVAELVPELNILEMPYLFNSLEEADYIIDQVLDAEISPKLEEVGLMLIIWAENGFKNLATVKGPINTIDDVSGLSIRTQESAIYQAIFKNMGMNAISLNVREVAQGLQAKIIDGFDNSPLFAYSSGLYHYTRHYTITEHTYQPVLLLLSKKVYDDLPKDLRPMFWSNRRELTRRGREMIRKGQFEALGKLREAGVEVNSLSMEQKSGFLQATRSVYLQQRELLGKNGERLLEKVAKTIEDQRRLK